MDGFSSRALLPSLLVSLALVAGACVQEVSIGGTGAGAAGGAPPYSTTSTTTSDWTTTVDVTTTSTVVSTGSSSAPWAGCFGPDKGLPPSACTPADSSCKSGSSVCLATADNQGKPVFGMRMTQLTLTLPTMLAGGVGQQNLKAWMMPNQPACHLGGAGSFSWVMRFDPLGGTLTSGAARANPDGSYSFLNGTLLVGDNSADLSPETLIATYETACGFGTTEGTLLNLGVQVNSGQLLYFPLRNLRFHDGFATPDHNCIGSYDLAGLDPSCNPQNGNAGFKDGAQVDAIISLEDADLVDIDILPMSLCVFLSGDSTKYGQQSGGVQRCKRDENDHIVFQGDWCLAGSEPAMPGCADALRFSGSFAASAVAIE